MFFPETFAQEYLAPALKEAQDLVLDSQNLPGQIMDFCGVSGLRSQVEVWLRFVRDSTENSPCPAAIWVAQVRITTTFVG